MTELEQPSGTAREFGRRGVIKGAAWSVPVIAAAVATPLAAASVGNADVVWASRSLQLLDIRLFNGGLINLSALPNGPASFSIINGAGVLEGPLDITISSVYTSGLSLGLGRPHGIGVYEFTGGVRTSWSETAPSGDLPLFRKPYTVTSTFTYAGDIASLATAVQNVSYRFSEAGGLLSVGALASFTLTLTVSKGGTVIGQDTSTLALPLNGSVL